jgi:EpsI family protein
LILIAAAQAGVYLIDREWTPAPAKLPDVDFDAWPLELGTWRGQAVPADQHSDVVVSGNWLYHNDAGAQISLLVGIWTEYTVVVPHSPEFCYKAVGWKPTSTKDIEVPVAGGAPITARIVFYERETERVAVLFWYQFGDKIIRSSEELRQFQQDLRGHATQLPPAIKVMLHTSAFDADSVESRMTNFASLVAAEVAKIH